MSTANVSRWLRGYDSQDEMRVEYHLPSSWTLEMLQGLLDLPQDDPMYDCYPVGEAQLERLAESLGIALPTETYEFFLEADAEDD